MLTSPQLLIRTGNFQNYFHFQLWGIYECRQKDPPFYSLSMTQARQAQWHIFCYLCALGDYKEVTYSKPER